MAEQSRVVIVGGGFGGLEVARKLRNSDVQITLVDRRNFHLFQPLLYQVATGGLSPANIATPLRAILRRQSNCQVLLAEAMDVDLVRNRLILTDGMIDFDYLVVAAGATHSYFGNDHWAPFAPGLKTIADATEIRRRVYLSFEAAERETDPVLRQQLMTFVVVGGGPTGVELAGAVAEIARYTLKNDFRHIDPEDARILLIEAGAHVLAFYPESLCLRAEAQIRKLGIEVHTNTKVVDINSEQVVVAASSGELTISTRTVLWAAGVQANPLGKLVAAACGVETDRTGRVPVDTSLNPGGQQNVFVIGDLAIFHDKAGRPLPGLAPVAIQQGQYVADRIRQLQAGKNTLKPFVYRSRGTMATIGRSIAVAQIGRFQFCGFIAWTMWLFIHLMQIVQFQNRLLILLQWAWCYLTFNRSARLITGDEHVPIKHSPSAARESAEQPED